MLALAFVSSTSALDTLLELREHVAVAHISLAIDLAVLVAVAWIFAWMDEQNAAAPSLTGVTPHVHAGFASGRAGSCSTWRPQRPRAAPR